MVKLKVYVRVTPESAYGADAGPAASRKFLVVVRDPAEWFVGTLAHEAQRTYQRLYRHELGQVKYLKDGDDNDLDPEQLVSDVFINEGKAARDGLDQEAVIKIIQEQGHAVRADSVVPDLTPAHYSRPPIPKFSALTSSLGKRSHGAIGESPQSGADKRSKLAEIPESQQVIPSVEQSPELIQDTQRELEEEDVFDDAKESHDTSQANGVSHASGPSQPPITPSNHGLPNGTTVLKSPAHQTSSATSKFKSSSRRDAYAYPESDIEDSQMSSALPKVLTNGVKDMQSIEQSSSQPTQSQDVVEAFNAHEALLPVDMDEAILANEPASMKALQSVEQKAASSKSEASDSESSDGREEPAQLKIAKTRKPPASQPDKTNAKSESKQQQVAKVAAQPEKSTPNGQKRKREPSRNSASDLPGGEKMQEKAAQQLGSAQSAAKSKKQKKNSISLDPQQLKPTLPASPSRRTSGVVSELDSPGEQLSQSLWDSAKGQHLAEGVKAALAGKQISKLDRLKLERGQKKADKAGSRSASSSRPSSRNGPNPTESSKKAAKKQSQPKEQTKTKPTAKAKEQAKKETPKAVQPSQSKSLKEKLADASSKNSGKPTEDAVGSGKKKRRPRTDEDSGSDADEGAPLPSIEGTKGAQTTPSTAKSTLPLPNWGSGSKETRSPSVNATPALVVPQGMTREEYLQLRHKHELTPQPPKTATSKKGKDSAPAISASAPAVPAKDLVNKGKKVVEKKSEMATTTAKKTVAAKSSSGDEETSSSSEESEEDTEAKPKNKTQKMSVSKSKSPAEVRKEPATGNSASKDKGAMPPPTPKSTAKRRESMNKQRAERSSSSAPTQDSRGSSSKSSASPAPAKVKADAMSSLEKKPSATPAKHTAAAKPTKPSAPEERKSGLKALRQKINSEAASSAASPAPSMTGPAKKKALPAPSSSSSESESSSDDEPAATKKQPTAKASTSTPLGRLEKKPDPAIRDPSPEPSSSSSSDESD